MSVAEVTNWAALSYWGLPMQQYSIVTDSSVLCRAKEASEGLLDVRKQLFPCLVSCPAAPIVYLDLDQLNSCRRFK